MKRIKVVVIVCLFSLLSMLVVQYISIITTLNYNNENREISFRSKKMGDVYSFMKIFVDIETGTRGFLLTEDQTFLEPRKIAIKELPLEIKKLSNYLSSQDIVTLERLSKIKLNHSDSLVEKKINNKKIFIHEYLFGKKAMTNIFISLLKRLPSLVSILIKKTHGERF